ncbi:uncharacterized protein B0H18DRAFT_585543 [Fomitopsis serialis]|uniref:uncharacterized protein n=1 Tax=Fomitopsis serialis TaxID=139415 RepID=UPI00200729A6|nr:uncharacterized protein B0H18DRAFT_585543 [Neoantrodia serialis]KAH9920718.1 hypothetical protein B0H18DRAFT_585543 [Neoantrodia serialis]
MLCPAASRSGCSLTIKFFPVVLLPISMYCVSLALWGSSLCMRLVNEYTADRRRPWRDPEPCFSSRHNQPQVFRILRCIVRLIPSCRNEHADTMSCTLRSLRAPSGSYWHGVNATNHLIDHSFHRRIQVSSCFTGPYWEHGHPHRALMHM